MNRSTDHQINRQADGHIAGGHLLAQRSGGAATLLERLYWRAAHQPERIAYEFLADEPLPVAESTLTVWTYGELYARVMTIAALLKQQFATAGSVAQEGSSDGPVDQPVLLVYPPGLELVAAFLGCLVAGAIAVPVPPPRRHESANRWRHIIDDARVTGILTCQSLVSDIEPLVRPLSPLKAQSNLRWLVTDAAETVLASPEIETAHYSTDKVAFLQYTSGSTSHPKGVMVTHGNLAHNLQQIQQAFGHSAATRCVIWLPPYHDMGLIGGILQPLYGGYPVRLLSPTSFLRRPVRWLEAIAHFKATTSGGPNFAYDYCAQKVSSEDREPLDLSSWTVAFTGAEPVRAQTLDRFSNAFASCGFQKTAFYPCYGLAEATLFASGGSPTAEPKVMSVSRQALSQNQIEAINDVPNRNRDEKETVSLVSCGQAIDQQIRIVDPQTGLASQQVGEIWLAGESVAAGYWGRVNETQEVFNATLADEPHRFLRTGDLGFLQAGDLFITGRLKDLIVIRGQNYYPQDIELSVGQSHSALQPTGAAFSLDRGEGEQLAIVQELNRAAVRSLRTGKLTTTEITAAIRAAVSHEYGLQVSAIALLKPGHLPRTTSGKVQRQACKAQFQAGTLECVEQWPDKPQESALEQPPEAQEKQDAETTEQLIAWLQAYARESINSRLIDERRCLSPGVVLDFGNKGLLGMQVPKKHGGLGLGHRSMLKIIAQLGAIDPTLALFVGLNNVLGVRPILHHASEQLRAQLLPKLATGRELAAFAITETGAGSHPFGITAEAVPTAAGWQLQGEKIWSGSAAWAGVINVFVRQVDAAGVPVGVSGFAVPKGAAGLRQGPEALTMGMRGMVQNTVFLENVPVSAAQMLGEAGQGMVVAQDAMMYGRLAIAAACVGGMKRCAQLMLRYSQRRTISTGRLLDNPVTLTRLSGLTNAIAALESLVTLTATRLDSGLSIPEEIYAACKITGPEFYWQAADHLMQCLGGRGYIETNLAPQIMRDARVLRIFEGPTESLSMYLGSRVLNQSEGLSAFFRELEVLEIGERLFESADQILAHYLSKKSPFSDELTARRQANFIVGRIAAQAILAAAIEVTDAPLAAITWVQQSFEQAVARALQTNPDEAAARSATETAEQIAEYQQSIGDVEQTLAGPDEAIDEWLKLDAQKVSKVHSHRVKSVAEGQRPLSEGKQAEAIATWIVQWLSQQLRISAAEIDRTKAFAEYGLDSVMAVELAQDLGGFLKLAKPLEATLAWNFPTIQALASYLATLNQSDNSAQQINPKESISEKILASDSPAFEELSDADVARALAAELAAVRGR